MSEVKALIAEALAMVRERPGLSDSVAETILKLVNALEVTRPVLVVESREALAERERLQFGISNGTQTWVEFQDAVGSVTDSLLASRETPKPWLDVEPGEVWVLVVDGLEIAGVVIRHQDGAFVSTDNCDYSVRDGRITAGRRIWPEAGDES